MKGIFTGKTFGDKAKNFGKVLLKTTGLGLLAKGIGSLFGFGGKKKKGKAAPKAEHGGTVTEGGLAEIHKNEIILPMNFLEKVSQVKGSAGSLAGTLGSDKGGGLAKKYMIPIIGPILAMGDLLSGKGLTRTGDTSPGMHDEMRRKKAGESGAYGSELAELRNINLGIQQLISLMGTSDTVGVSPDQVVGSSLSIEKPKSIPSYGQWPTTRGGTTPTKSTTV